MDEDSGLSIPESMKTVDSDLKRKDHSEDLGVNGRTISEWILGK
jgi:hypothetical protein